MPVIAFVSQKGGVSKSTSSVHYACWVAKKGQKVLLVDTDVQHSAIHWLDGLGSSVETLAIHDQGELISSIAARRSSYDYIVIDAPAQLADLTRGILFAADLAVVPLQPTGLDLDSAFACVELVKQARLVRAGLPKACLFVSRAIKGTALKTEAQTAISKLEGIPALQSVIHQRQAIADCFGQKTTVFDMKGRAASASAREYKSLFLEIEELLINE